MSGKGKQDGSISQINTKNELILNLDWFSESYSQSESNVRKSKSYEKPLRKVETLEVELTEASKTGTGSVNWNEAESELEFTPSRTSEDSSFTFEYDIVNSEEATSADLEILCTETSNNSDVTNDKSQSVDTLDKIFRGGTVNPSNNKHPNVTTESVSASVESIFENNKDFVHKFHAKMHRVTKIFVLVHVFLSSCGAIAYSVVSISSTNEWRDGLDTEPGWHIPGGFVANVALINILAAAVNLNLCFAALLIVGFHKHCRMLIWMWYLGQFTMEIVVTGTLISSVLYECKLSAILSIPPFLYYVISLATFRQILATVSLSKYMEVWRLDIK